MRHLSQRLTRLERVFLFPRRQEVTAEDFSDVELWWIVCGERRPMPPDDELDRILIGVAHAPA
jgi:hypothetical protein